MQITTPSGFSGEVRKLKGSEANILSDRKAARKGETYDKILRACWLETGDPGPYSNSGVSAEATSIPWGKILVCDRFVILAAIRAATYGSSYCFPVKCGESGRGCGFPFEWEVDLESEVPLYPLPAESIAKIAEGNNRFETELDGTRIVFKLLTGTDERRAGKDIRKNKSELFTTALASRIVEVDGKDRRAVKPWLETLDLGFQLELLGKFEDVDGGFETELEVECPDCDRIQTITVPFEGEAFWLPRSRKRSSSEATGRKTRKARTMATMGKKDEKTEETTTSSDT